MKYFLASILILSSLFLTSQAQNSSANENIFGKMTLAVVMPSYVEGLEDSHLEKLKSSIIEILTSNGLASFQSQNHLVLYPTIQLLDDRSVNAGVQNMTLVEAEISLFIKQPDNNILFATITKKLRGSGRTRVLALNNMLDRINKDKESYAGFIEKGKQKAINYYNSDCERIIEQAEKFSKTNQFVEALNLLFSIPEETSCFQKSKPMTIEIFKSYQAQTCQRMLQNAKAKLANRQFEEALGIISQMDPQAPCAPQTNELIIKATQETSQENKSQWETLQKLFADSSQLERYRLQLINDLLTKRYGGMPIYDYSRLNQNHK